MHKDTRSEALHVIRERPGASIADVARTLGVDHSTAEYHLHRLRRARVAVSEEDGRTRRWYAAGCGFCPVLRAGIPLAHDPRHARLLQGLVNEGPQRAVDLARREDVPLLAVRWFLEQAAAKGLVERAGAGRYAVAKEAEPCARHVLTRHRCGLWGRCAMSHRHLAGGGGGGGGAS